MISWVIAEVVQPRTLTISGVPPSYLYGPKCTTVALLACSGLWLFKCRYHAMPLVAFITRVLVDQLESPSPGTVVGELSHT